MLARTQLLVMTCVAVMLLAYLAIQRGILADAHWSRVDLFQHNANASIMTLVAPATVAYNIYNRSLSESYGFMRDLEVDWEQKKRNHMHQEGRQRYSDAMLGSVFYQQNWEPTWSCDYEQRIGSQGDGGKWMCDPYKVAMLDTCTVVSIGSNNDWSFESAVHDLNPLCNIFTFDHTIEGQNIPPFVRFFKLGLGAPMDANVLVKPLDQLLEAAGIQNTDIDIFKIDCEGCEAVVYPQFFSQFIRQILIELHMNDGVKNHAFFEMMRAHGYVIFHKEPNTLGCGGNCIEYAFIKLAIEI